MINTFIMNSVTKSIIIYSLCVMVYSTHTHIRSRTWCSQDQTNNM